MGLFEIQYSIQDLTFDFRLLTFDPNPYIDTQSQWLIEDPIRMPNSRLTQFEIWHPNYNMTSELRPNLGILLLTQDLSSDLWFYRDLTLTVEPKLMI